MKPLKFYLPYTIYSDKEVIGVGLYSNSLTTLLQGRGIRLSKEDIIRINDAVSKRVYAQMTGNNTHIKYLTNKALLENCLKIGIKVISKQEELNKIPTNLYTRYMSYLKRRGFSTIDVWSYNYTDDELHQFLESKLQEYINNNVEIDDMTFTRLIWDNVIVNPNYSHAEYIIARQYYRQYIKSIT